ncbi:MAG TPA: hypothetical protein PK864_06575 [Syntrophorhabdaceae bacterium]|nr:hypothetical protein [Syntrophorhabdaceae bacterium]HOT42983.1 hypothetical protein [Syntrophorhabdaceae bacterium]HPC66832.1 hypothetical protein [Syntrophorhabdaceae bacterium]HQE79352.1 hypothetical protein [Syntrophorhabdaceae bacterium]HQH43005.1 hypothetical protein [Syntrophorhabdaceae bacterium]
MWKIISNIIEMFIYSAVYIVVLLVSLKIVGASISADFEKKIVNEGNTGLSIICGCLLIGIAIVISGVFR